MQTTSCSLTKCVYNSTMQIPIVSSCLLSIWSGYLKKWFEAQGDL